MDLKPSELMQIDDVPVAYSCIIIKVSLKHTSMIPFDPLINNIVVRIEIAGIIQK